MDSRTARHRSSHLDHLELVRQYRSGPVVTMFLVDWFYNVLASLGECDTTCRLRHPKELVWLQPVARTSTRPTLYSQSHELITWKSTLVKRTRRKILSRQGLDASNRRWFGVSLVAVVVEFTLLYKKQRFAAALWTSPKSPTASGPVL